MDEQPALKYTDTGWAGTRGCTQRCSSILCKWGRGAAVKITIGSGSLGNDRMAQLRLATALPHCCCPGWSIMSP